MGDIVPITHFRGNNYFLSSMYPVKPGIVTPDQIVVPTVEHYYQAAKFVEPADRVIVQTAKDGFKAKQLAHGLAERGAPIRPDWEAVKVDVMRTAVEQKFKAGSRLGYLLVHTDSEELIEGNTRGETFWGRDATTNQGENMLGKILMERRQRLAEEQRLKKHK